MRILAVAAVLLLAVSGAQAQDPPPAAAAASLVTNPSFEDTPMTPSRWDLWEAATTGNNGMKSEVAIDTTVFRTGKQSLRLAGSGGVTSWQAVRQKIAVRPGDRVTLRVAARCVGLRREGAQNANANAILDFIDGTANSVTQLEPTPVLRGDLDWTDLVISALVPEKATGVRIGLVLTQTGTVWFDDVRLEVAHASISDAPGRAAALGALQDHMRATYPFFGLNGKPHAEEWIASWTPRLAEAKDDETFVAGVRQMLGQLDDLHIWMKRSGKVIGTVTAAPVRSNLVPATRKAMLTEIIDEQPPLLAARIGAGAEAVGYIEIATWQMKEDVVARLEKDLNALGDCRGLVLDVRANTGGDETIAQRIATRFCAADVVYARSRLRDALGKTEDALLPPFDRSLTARRDAKPDQRPVAVLQGRICMSSTEAFLLMARALPTVTTLGERSRGASGRPLNFHMTPELAIVCSTWRAYTPDDVLIEGAGVLPEVPVESVKGKDAVLEAAVALVRK